MASSTGLRHPKPDGAAVADPAEIEEDEVRGPFEAAV
jgi:hypothetical protein